MKSGDNCTLALECAEEPLSESQLKLFETKNNLFREQMAAILELVKSGALVQNLDNAQEDVVLRYRSSNRESRNTSAMSRVGDVDFAVDATTGRMRATLKSVTTPRTTTRSSTKAATKKGKVAKGKSSKGSQRQKSTPKPIVSRTSSPKTSSPAPLVDLTDSKRGSMTITTSPSTTIMSAPSLHTLQVFPRVSRPHPQAASKRTELDRMVKGFLVLPMAELMEWFIQKGIVPTEKYHITPSTGNTQKMELIQSQSDVFASSGGYVWVAHGRSKKQISALQDTILDVPQGSSKPHGAVVVLKLIYHWSCQTPHANVCQWVKVTDADVCHFNTLMRGLCVTTVQNDFNSLGGAGKVVEVGVISLGTSAEGNKRTVKVEVLGILERTSGRVRMRASTPLSAAGQADRFKNVFKCLQQWVRPETRLVIDFSIDKTRLRRIGFKNVVQLRNPTTMVTNTNDENTGNVRVMTFLKKVVPRTFQSSLSVLTTSQIQQFLDELSFREYFGQYSLQCFNSAIAKLAVQTRHSVTANCTVESRLQSAAMNPFDDWRPTAIIKGIESCAKAQSSTSKRKSTSQLAEPSGKRSRGRKRTGGTKTSSKSSLNMPKHAVVSQNLEETAFNDVSNEDCAECGKKMATKGHLAAHLSCSKCRYSTCCSRSMGIHGLIFHNNSKPKFSLGVPLILESEMHCVCGFKTNSGNKMANHLGMHNCTSAYPSAEEAAKAALPSTNAYFAPLVDLEDSDDMDASVAMAKAYRQSKSMVSDTIQNSVEDTPGPLAFLGLKAKTVNEESSNDRSREETLKEQSVESNLGRIETAEETVEGNMSTLEDIKERTVEENTGDVKGAQKDIAEKNTSEVETVEKENANEKQTAKWDTAEENIIEAETVEKTSFEESLNKFETAKEVATEDTFETMETEEENSEKSISKAEFEKGTGEESLISRNIAPCVTGQTLDLQELNDDFASYEGLYAEAETAKALESNLIEGRDVEQMEANVDYAQDESAPVADNDLALQEIDAQKEPTGMEAEEERRLEKPVEIEEMPQPTIEPDSN